MKPFGFSRDNIPDLSITFILSLMLLVCSISHAFDLQEPLSKAEDILAQKVGKRTNIKVKHVSLSKGEVAAYYDVETHVLYVDDNRCKALAAKSATNQEAFSVLVILFLHEFIHGYQKSLIGSQIVNLSTVDKALCEGHATEFSFSLAKINGYTSPFMDSFYESSTSALSIDPRQRRAAIERDFNYVAARSFIQKKCADIQDLLKLVGKDISFYDILSATWNPLGFKPITRWNSTQIFGEVAKQIPKSTGKVVDYVEMDYLESMAYMDPIDFPDTTFAKVYRHGILLIMQDSHGHSQQIAVQIFDDSEKPKNVMLNSQKWMPSANLWIKKDLQIKIYPNKNDGVTLFGFANHFAIRVDSKDQKSALEIYRKIIVILLRMRETQGNK
ncbi:MAG: hypothetical protein H7240_09275 [Glaciimonas sp.]|nr:hypothetical protein [Glaciimonas sp.]